MKRRREVGFASMELIYLIAGWAGMTLLLGLFTTVLVAAYIKLAYHYKITTEDINRLSLRSDIACGAALICIIKWLNKKEDSKVSQKILAGIFYSGIGIFVLGFVATVVFSLFSVISSAISFIGKMLGGH